MSQIARDIIKDERLAEDVIQESWQRFLGRKKRDLEYPRAYLAQIVRNTAIQAIRKRKRSKELGLEEEQWEGEVLDEATRLGNKREMAEVVHGALQQLPVKFKRPLQLKYFHGDSARIIAAKLHISENYVHSLLQRARIELRNKLLARFDGDMNEFLGCMIWIAGAEALLEEANSLVLQCNQRDRVQNAIRSPVKLNSYMGIVFIFLCLTAIFILSFDRYGSRLGTTNHPFEARVKHSTYVDDSLNEEKRTEAEESDTSHGTGQIKPVEREISGTVHDDSGRPVSNAWVGCLDLEKYTRTNANGEFAIQLSSSVSRQRSIHLAAWSEGFGVEQLEVEGFVNTPIVLQSGIRRIIQVVSKDGFPIVSAKAFLYVYSSRLEDKGVAMTLEVPAGMAVSDIEGNIELPPISTRVFMKIKAQGYEDTIKEIWPVSTIRDPGRGILYGDKSSNRAVMEREYDSFEVRFVTTEGIPIRNAEVHFGIGMPGHLMWHICHSFFQSKHVTRNDGWVKVPSLARHWCESVMIVEGDRLHAVYLGDRGLDRRLVPGQTIVIGCGVRGRLISKEKDATFDQYEIALSFGYSYSIEGVATIGFNYPDPSHNPDLLAWYPVNRDGFFLLESGWKSVLSQHFPVFNVRRQDNSGLTYSFKGNAGESDPTLELPMERRTVICFSQSTEEQASGSVVLSTKPLCDSAELNFNPEYVQAMKLDVRHGKAEAFLPSSTYTVGYWQQGWDAHLPLGSFQVGNDTGQHEFIVPTTRSLKGKVFAHEKPVFPCIVGLEGSNYSARVYTDFGGRWKISGVPNTPLQISASPRDGLLGDTHAQQLGEHCLAYDLNLPVGSLELVNVEQLESKYDFLTFSRTLDSENFKAVEVGAGRAWRMPWWQPQKTMHRLPLTLNTLNVMPGSYVVTARHWEESGEERGIAVDVREGEITTVDLSMQQFGWVLICILGGEEQYHWSGGKLLDLAATDDRDGEPCLRFAVEFSLSNQNTGVWRSPELRSLLEQQEGFWGWFEKPVNRVEVGQWKLNLRRTIENFNKDSSDRVFVREEFAGSLEQEIEVLPGKVTTVLVNVSEEGGAIQSYRVH